MNRELKVPAALAIMLVGFGAMVFWCGKPQDDAGAETAHEDFSDIDAEIQDRPHTPHLTGLENASDAPASRQDQQSVADSSDDDGWLSWLHGADSADTDLVSGDGKSATDGASHSRQQERGDGRLIISRPVEGGHSLGPATDELDFNAEQDLLNSRDRNVAGETTGGGNAVPEPIQSALPSAPLAEHQYRHNEGWDVVTPSASDDLPQNRPRPNVSQRRTYTIQPGDTLSRIAAKFLGASHRAGEIFEANRDVLDDPNQLTVGTEIVIPDISVAPPESAVEPNGPVAENSAACRTSSRNSMFVPVSSSPLRNPVRELSGDSVTETAPVQAPREYTVRRGDSLERIAIRFYGTRTKALDIFRANAQQLRSPNSIRAGMTLVLP